MTTDESKPLLRRECDHCELKTEVKNMKEWVRGIDRRQWAGFFLAITNLLAAVGVLLVMFFKLMPAIASAGGK